MPSSNNPTLPIKQIAVIAEGAGKLSLRHDAPVPTLGPNFVMVKTAAVAINPVDAKMLDYSPVPGAIHGYDFAGTIVALGTDTPSTLSVGDRVAGTVHGMNPSLPDVGAFAEYVAAPGDLLLKIPDGMSFEEASSIGLGLFTAGLGLFQELGVPSSIKEPYSPRPDDEYDFGPEFVLVAGGATATGTRAIQLLKLAGLRPIATCSPSNFELARSFGAEEVFDYHTSDCASEIKAYTRNTLAYAFDCVAMADTMQLCYAAMGRAGGRYVTLEPYRHEIASTRPTIQPSWLLALTIFGIEVNLEGDYKRDAKPEDRKFGESFVHEMQKLLDKGKIHVHPVQVRTGGWQGVLEGVDFIRKEKMSGQKLVYSV